MNTYFSKIRLTLFTFLCVTISALTTSAQPIPVNIGDNITGALAFQGDVDSYSFCSFANDKIYIRANSDDISYLGIEVYDPQGNEIDNDTGFSLTEILLTLPESGEYIVVVKSPNEGQGEYFLSLQSTFSPRGVIPLICNGIVMDSLSFTTQIKVFNFSVEPETVVNIVLVSPEISYERLKLYNSSGIEVASDITVGTAEIQITLTDECHYLFVMSHNGGDIGDFTIAFNIITGGCTNICPVNEICDNNIDDDGDGLIDLQDEDCCSATSLPVATITGNLELCEGENSTLTAGGGTDYQWSTGDNTPSITVTDAGDYTVTVNNNNGTDTETVSVIVNDLPMVNFALEVGLDTFCINETNVQLSGGTPTGGNYSGTGISNNIFEPSTAGLGTHTLTYTFTDVEGCTNSATQETVVIDADCTTGINDIKFKKSVRIFPNPSDENFTILIEDWSSEIKLELFDMYGRLIYAKEAFYNSIRLEKMPEGLFLLRLSSDGVFMTEKLVVY